MVGLPASGPKIDCKPGRVATPPLLKMTSWQSGETPCGKSAGDISVTRPPKISMGASCEPAVVMCVQVDLVGCQKGRSMLRPYKQWAVTTSLLRCRVGWAVLGCDGDRVVRGRVRTARLFRGRGWRRRNGRRPRRA